ncbi:hypothetical protein C8R44DRAFT_870488 [Mycena epipterygia]|nr:hypothetical protein C8R44DRAFT_870488 [Mycena epipterygia]
MLSEVTKSRKWRRLLYEGILHRIPSVRILKASHVIVLPKYPTVVIHFLVRYCSVVEYQGWFRQYEVSVPWSEERKAGNKCYPKGGTIFHRYSGEIKSTTFATDSAFETPDMCIAANSCLATCEPAFWCQTLKMLVASRVYGVRSAHRRARPRTAARERRQLLPSLSPAINPFGSLIMDPNFDKVHGFHVPNAWFTGAFR